MATLEVGHFLIKGKRRIKKEALLQGFSLSLKLEQLYWGQSVDVYKTYDDDDDDDDREKCTIHCLTSKINVA